MHTMFRYIYIYETVRYCIYMQGLKIFQQYFKLKFKFKLCSNKMYDPFKQSLDLDSRLNYYYTTIEKSALNILYLSRNQLVSYNSTYRKQRLK